MPQNLIHCARVGGVMLWCAALVWGQDKAAEKQKLGTVSGVVVDGKSGEPVRKVTVILRPVAQPSDVASAIALLQKGVGTATDVGGKFRLEDVEPSSYAVTAERDGYAIARESERQIVTVTAGKTQPDLHLKMLRTGAISGRVLDADGDPVPSANVQVMPLRQPANNRGSWASTNDKGEYRVFHLAPGKYKISVTYNVVDRYPSQLGIRMQSSANGAGLSAYPTLYYPGTVNPQQAAIVNVDPGSEMPGVDLHLRLAHSVTIRGRVTGPGSSLPASLTMISLSPVKPEAGQDRQAIIQDPEGGFELKNVLPGAYRLQATRIEMPADNVTEMSRLTGERKLTVGEDDVTGIQLSLGLPHPLSGRVIPPEGRKLPSGLTVMLQPRESGNPQSGDMMAAVDAKGNFTFKSSPIGELFILIGSGNAGDHAADDLYISAIRLGDVDALADGLLLDGNPSQPLEITLKANGGTLEASVKDEKGAALFPGSVLLVPDAPKQQQMALYGDCRTDLKGNCRISGITPGEYHAFGFASENVPIDQRGPEALKAYEKQGIAVKFAEGQKQKVELLSVVVE